jgi:hypothetical protein
MNSAERRSPADRDRAVTRLRTITIGTGLAGVVAVGGFGAIAALSDDGTGTSEGVITAAVTTDAGATTSTTSTSTGTTSATSTAATTSTSNSTSSSLSSTTTPVTTTGTAHASTGSS